MVHNFTYLTNIIDALGILAFINVTETIWEKYEKYVIGKIKDATLKLRGALFYIKELTPAEAQKELDTLNTFMPTFNKLKAAIKNIDNPQLEQIKRTAMEFFKTIDLMQEHLQDIAQAHAAYEMSIPVLAVDWDSEEDNHWDEY